MLSLGPVSLYFLALPAAGCFILSQVTYRTSSFQVQVKPNKAGVCPRLNSNEGLGASFSGRQSINHGCQKVLGSDWLGLDPQGCGGGVGGGGFLLQRRLRAGPTERNAGPRSAGDFPPQTLQPHPTHAHRPRLCARPCLRS